MNTYTFVSQNTSMVLTLSAPTQGEAETLLEETVRPKANDFRLEEVEDENGNDIDIED